MESINLIFFGRLEKEKGFDLVLKLLDKLEYEKRINQISLTIFGEGSFSKYLDKYTKRYDNIKFYGRKSFDYIKEYLKKSDYCLMPSRFLETFGLVGLESISYGVPVIGFGKGGLSQFVVHELDIFRQGSFDNVSNFYLVIESILDGKYSHDELIKKSLSISENYSKENWISLVNSNFKGDKILFVNDYLTDIGGIETYIDKSAKTLSDSGKQVLKFGWKIPKGSIWTKIRKLGLVCTAFNFVFLIKYLIKINIFKPDIVWYHSVFRFLGWVVLPFGKIKQRYIMYHDFGFMFPYPSKVYDLSQLEYKFCYKNFMKAAGEIGFFSWIIISLKYLNLLIIRRLLLKHIDKHFVPSIFMVDILVKYYGVPKEKVFVIPHYL